MEINEYAQLVKSMREAQKTYFRTRYTEDLNKSKKLEKQVDEATEGILKPKQEINQQKLF